jgi:hypothetical protein
MKPDFIRIGHALNRRFHITDQGWKHSVAQACLTPDQESDSYQRLLNYDIHLFCR